MKTPAKKSIKTQTKRDYALGIFWGTDFKFQFWCDKSTKKATDDGENNFQFPLIYSHLQTLKTRPKIFDKI